MRIKTLVMLGLAVVFGLAAVLAGNQWLMRQASLQQRSQPVVAAAPVQPTVPMTTVVVAGMPLRYGMELTPSHLREIPWPEAAVPQGAFRSVAEFLGPQGPGHTRRVVLAAMEPNEPVMGAKVTGPGQRGTLSSLIEEGMGAVTIRVNEVVGVAGFVLPGDRVDILLTRQVAGGETKPGQSAFADVVLQNVRVLAIGQTADERTEKPSIVNAVTVAVDPVGAQKVALASAAGSLSLVLRRAGETASTGSRRVSLDEIGHRTAPETATAAAPQAVTVRVTRAMKREEYTVPTGPGAAPALDTAARAPRVAAAQAAGPTAQ